MKRILISLLSALFMTVMLVLPALAATTATVTVTATPTYIAITNSPASYDFGVIAASATPATSAGYFSITNTSSVATNISIWAVAITGGVGWTLNTTGAPGTDQAGMYAGIVSGTFGTVVTTSPGAVIKSSLAASTSQTWHLKLMAPTSFTDGVQKSTTVTISAAAS
jgi:hypothetical protein